MNNFSLYSQVLNVNHNWESDYTELLEAHHLLKTRYLKMKSKLQEVEEENTRLVAKYEHKIDSEQQQQQQQLITIDDMNAIKIQVEILTFRGGFSEGVFYFGRGRTNQYSL